MKSNKAFDSMKATMSIVGTLAMLVAVCVINFDKDLALAAALAGGFTLSIENMIPSLPVSDGEDKTYKTKDSTVEHKFQTYDLIKKGPRRVW